MADAGRACPPQSHACQGILDQGVRGACFGLLFAGLVSGRSNQPRTPGWLLSQRAIPCRGCGDRQLSHALEEPSPSAPARRRARAYGTRAGMAWCVRKGHPLERGDGRRYRRAFGQPGRHGRSARENSGLRALQAEVGQKNLGRGHQPGRNRASAAAAHARRRSEHSLSGHTGAQGPLRARSVVRREPSRAARRCTRPSGADSCPGCRGSCGSDLKQ